MCGIVGVINGETSYSIDMRRFFTQAIIADSFRGRDSTGVMGFPKDFSKKEHTLFKKAIPGWDFAELSMFDKFTYDMDKFKYVVGHNRAATKGAVNSVNAHPFQHGHISLVHNGSLNTHSALTKARFDVDSEAICAAFAERDPRDVIPELNGAFALVWTDLKTGYLHMVRNDERPLSFAKLKNKDIILIASESDMLRWIAARNKLQIDKLYNLEEGHLLTFGVDEKQVTEWHSEKVKLRQPAWYSTGRSHKVGTQSYLPKKTERKKESGGGGENERYKHINAMLAPHGYKHDDVVEIFIDKVTPFHNSAGGTIKRVHSSGYTAGPGPALDVLVYSVKETDVTVGDFFLGSIIGVQAPSVTGDAPTLVIDNKNFTKYEPSDNNEEEDKELGETTSGEPRFLPGPNGDLSYNEFCDKTKDGCIMCAEPISVNDADEMEWTLDGSPICPTCAGDFPTHKH